VGRAPRLVGIRPGRLGVGEKALGIQQTEDVHLPLAIGEPGQIGGLARRGQDVVVDRFEPQPRHARRPPGGLGGNGGKSPRLLQERGLVVALAGGHRRGGGARDPRGSGCVPSPEHAR